MLRRYWGIVALIGLILLGFILSESQLSLLTEMLIVGLFAMSLNLMMGYGGMVSFGHAVYYGVGAYTVAILTLHYDVPPEIALILAPFVSALMGAVLGWLCVRLVHLYFSILTLAFGQMFYILALQGGEFTGGDNGLLGFPVIGFLQTETQFYLFTLLIVGMCWLMMWRMVNTPFFLTLRAIKENPTRAEGIGVNVKQYYWRVFVMSAFFAGLAGGLVAQHHRLVAVDMFFWTTSAEALLGSLLGGMGVLFGPALGGGLLVFLEITLTRFTTFWALALGILTIACVLLMPSGLLGWLKKWQETRQENAKGA